MHGCASEMQCMSEIVLNDYTCTRVAKVLGTTDQKGTVTSFRTESATVELCSKPPSGLTCGTPGSFLQRRRDVLAHVYNSCHVNNKWGSSA